MSQTVHGGVDTPWARGIRYGQDINNPLHARFFAYQHPHGDTWFGGAYVNGHPPDEDPNRPGWVYFSMSAVHVLRIPAKVDQEVVAITDPEYQRLQLLETEFWDDHRDELDRIFLPAQQAALAAGIPWVRPVPTAAQHLQAIQFAHQEVINQNRYPRTLLEQIAVLGELYTPPVHGGIFSGGAAGASSNSGLDIPLNRARDMDFEAREMEDTTSDEEGDWSEDDDDELCKPHLDPFERDWSEKWLNGIVRRAQGWIEEHPDAEDELGGSDEDEWGLKEIEEVLRDATAVLAIMAGTGAAGSLTRHLGFPIHPSLAPALRKLRKSTEVNPNHSPETNNFLSSLSLSPSSPTTSFLSNRYHTSPKHNRTKSHSTLSSSPETARSPSRKRKRPILPILLHDAPMSDHLNVGVQTWGSAILLGREIALHPKEFGLFRDDRPVRILELGAGTGLLSILCRKLLDLNVQTGGMGGEVVATDFLGDVLDNLRVCVGMNGGGEGGVRVGKLDWCTFPGAVERGEVEGEEVGGLVGEGFDLVLASDCVYDETHAGMIRNVAGWVVRLPDEGVPGDLGGTLHILSPLRPTFGPELQSTDRNFPLLSSYRSLSERVAAVSKSHIEDEALCGQGMGRSRGLKLGVRGEGKRSVKGRKGEGRVDEGDGYWWWEVGWG